MNDESEYIKSNLNNNKSELFGLFEDFLHKIFKKSDDETQANLSTIEWLIYIGTLLFVLIMPFLYSRLTTENFLTPKEFFTRILVGTIGGIFFCKVFLKHKVYLAKTYLDFPLVAFLGFCTLSVIWNYNAISAIRDLRCVLVIMLLFPIIVNVFRSRWQVELLLWIAVFTGVATATIGYMETYNYYFKIDALFPWVHYVKDQVLAKDYDPNSFYIPFFPQLASPDYAMGSVVSTFGNRNYLGTFAMFIAFIPLAFFFYYKKPVMKIFSLGVFGWLLYGLYTTRCRASLIGLVVGFIFMFIMTLINDKKFNLTKKYGLFLSITILLFLLSGLIISARTIKSESMWDKIKLTFTLNRLVSNTYERMWVWYGNNKAFTESIKTLLIGKGFGSFKHFFPLKEGEIFSHKNKESFTAVTFRQAHNDWLQIFSELGIIGMVLFLFLVKRIYASIQNSLRKDIFGNEDGAMNGDHIMLIALGGAIVAQLFAGLPDFPFHRIETAVFAVVFLALMPVFTETEFFKKPPKIVILEGIKQPINNLFVLVVMIGMIGNLYHELRCWEADKKVRDAEMIMTYRSNDLIGMLKARMLLLSAIELDPLPGDPYNKLSAWYEQTMTSDLRKNLPVFVNMLKSGRLYKDNPQVAQIMKNMAYEFNYSELEFVKELSDLVEQLNDAPRLAFEYSDKAWNNINFNARSTYHSIIFRRMHLFYHILHNPVEAYKQALNGLDNTAGDARKIYYYYGGKIADEILDNPMLSKDFDVKELEENVEKFLKKLLDTDQFKAQANASLATFFLKKSKYVEARHHALEAAKSAPNDPTMQYIIGISSFNLGENSIAVQAISNAIKYNPSNPLYHKDLALIYKKQKKYDEAKKHFQICASASNCPSDIKKGILKELESINELQKIIQKYGQ